MTMSNNGLSKLVEELGELLQASGKFLAYPKGDHPDGGPPLRTRIVEEMGDVMAAIRFVCEAHDGMSLEEVEARAAIKLGKFRRWHRPEAPLTGELRSLVHDTVRWLSDTRFWMQPKEINACPGWHAWDQGKITSAEWRTQLQRLLDEGS